MGETLHKHQSLFSRAAGHFRMTMTAALALALGIGVNAAIFNLEGLGYGASVSPDSFNLFTQSDLRYQAAEANTSSDEAHEQERGADAQVSGDSLLCVLTRARDTGPAFELKGRALLLEDCLITLSPYRERAGAGYAIALESQ